MKRKLLSILYAIGPGIFCIGYTVGTGSVTSMAKAGSAYGSQLLWVLAISCLFSWALMEAYGRYAVVTGRTAINSFKTEFKYGKLMAIIVVVGVVIGQMNSLAGIVGLTSNAIYEIIRLFIPALNTENYLMILGISVVMLIVLYGLLITGSISLFEKILIFFVTIMGISFLISMFMVLPSPSDIARGLIPSIPKTQGGKLLVAAFVGTTMAGPTFIIRPLLMKGKNWGVNNIKDQSRDSLVSATLLFVISGSVMITSMGALYYNGLTIERVIDMVQTLEPVAGKFSVALFMVGALSAGISSVFPILMVAPLLIADYKDGSLDTSSQLFKILTAVACVIGLSIPIMGANPIVAQIASQVANVFILPLIIFGIIYLINSKQRMGNHRAGLGLNITLAMSLIFACIISWLGFNALLQFF